MINYNKIIELVYETYKEVNIDRFPVDVYELLEHYKLDIIPYTSLNQEKQNACYNYSNDAFTLMNKVYYNDKIRSKGRIRFSLMHELGHKRLEHTTNTELTDAEKEIEANTFASYILAPRVAVHHCLANSQNITSVFGVTNAAAQVITEDYKRWYYHSFLNGVSPTDKKIFKHFYNDKYGKFIYSKSVCAICDKELINDPDVLCNECQLKLIFKNHKNCFIWN